MSFTKLKKITLLTGIFLLTLLFCINLNTHNINAATFKYKDYAAGKTVKYKGVIPTYVVDGVTADFSTQPPLISERGIAYANVKALFKDMIGAKTSFNKSLNRITVSYGGHTLRMYLGSTKVEFDGEELEAPCEPFKIKYKSSKITAYMVPTRYVAEAFGFGYNWDSETETVTITVPMLIEFNGIERQYTGTRGKISYEGEPVAQPETCSLIYEDTALINASCELFEDDNPIGINYFFDDETGMIDIECDEHSINYCLDSKISYVDGLLARNPYAPMIVSFKALKKSYVYLPGRFTFENLGFYYNWNDETKTSEIYNTAPVVEEEPEEEETDPEKEEETEKQEEVKLPLELINVFNTDEGYKFFIDRENCRQEIKLDLPMISKKSEIDIRDDVLGCRTDLVIKGDHSEYFKDVEISNSGEAILQIQIWYDPNEDETIIRFLSDLVMGAAVKKNDDESFTVTFDFVKNLYKKVVVIDAGHGDHDPGAQHGGYDEKDLNLKILNYAREYFKETDVKAFFTRTDDTFLTLYERADFAELVGADMFISVHHNSAWNEAAHGTSIYYGSKDTYTSLNGLTSETLAWRMLDALLKNLGTEQFSTGVINQNFVVVRDSKAPAVLLEIGFMSNSTELKKLVKNKFAKKAAKTIVDTVLDIYAEAYPEDVKDKETDTETDIESDTETDTETDPETDTEPDKDTVVVG